MLKRIIATIFLLAITSPSLAWSATGHYVITKIAYDNLSMHAKHRINHILKTIDPKHPLEQKLLYSSSWPDTLKYHGISAFNHCHYINYPINHGGKAKTPSKYNLVWAINQTLQTIKSPKSNEIEKAIALRFLIHLEEDAHQPVHCSSLYSKKFPNGDRGGNLYHIESHIAKNLHALWDRGVGSLTNKRGKPLKKREWQELASKIQAQHPKNKLKAKINDLTPDAWVKESFNIANNFVYKIKPLEKLRKDYIAKGKEISKYRLALAGYRLATMLNQIF